jgi:hypothetical protein
MPKYTDATYGNETKVLENNFMRVEVHKRKTGWGWAEIYTPQGKLMGVLPHLSELQDNLGGKRGIMVAPRRLESTDVVEENTPEGQSLIFNVHSLTNYEFSRGSFVEYMADPNEKPAMTGQVRLTLNPNQAVLQLDYRFRWLGLPGLAALRGPWLLVGTDSFGIEKTDAVFPGIEWLRKEEWSSNRNYMLAPLAERTAPHPFKVSIPLMAVSHEGNGIGFAWDPLHPLTERRPMDVTYYPQPVFSSPNAVDHANQHLMGLMFPSAVYTGKENAQIPDQITPCDMMCTISFKAEVFLAEGNSLDVLTDWVRRHGLPKPPKPRRRLSETLEFISKCYDTNFWIENTGWAFRLQRDIARSKKQEDAPSSSYPPEPVHIRRYLREYGDTEIGRSLAKKFEIASGKPGFGIWERDPIFLNGLDRDKQVKHGRNLLSLQKPDGSFVYEPHNPKSLTFLKSTEINHLPFAQNTHKPLGFEGDTALEINVVPAIHLLRIADMTGEESFKQAAYRALDFCMPYVVPDGGDVWETPLHSPNLLAAGHAAIAYELAYRASGKQEYREKAVYWLRGLLVFTNLWEPKNVLNLYCTKPCLCATDWNTVSWVDTHVQWEVLQSWAIAIMMGIDWAEVDPEIDWDRYEEGIACAATHWILDKSRADELPHDIDLALGNIDGTLADAHDPITGQHFGWQLMPDYLAVLLMDVLKREKT